MQTGTYLLKLLLFNYGFVPLNNTEYIIHTKSPNNTDEHSHSYISFSLTHKCIHTIKLSNKLGIYPLTWFSANTELTSGSVPSALC